MNSNCSDWNIMWRCGTSREHWVVPCAKRHLFGLPILIIGLGHYWVWPPPADSVTTTGLSSSTHHTHNGLTQNAGFLAVLRSKCLSLMYIVANVWEWARAMVTSLADDGLWWMLPCYGNLFSRWWSLMNVAVVLCNLGQHTATAYVAMFAYVQLLGCINFYN